MRPRAARDHPLTRAARTRTLDPTRRAKGACMSWFKVDDKLHSHPKWLALPKGARALWITAGSWSSSQLSDGFVPKSVLVFLDGTAREAAALVASGLWETAPGGWQFHDWEEYQPTRQIVTARREANAQRLRDWRERKRDETHV